MGLKGQQTRENILACAEGIILQRGYSGTSLEDIIRDAGVTKGGFFYHFDGKSDLAKKLMLRYLEQDKVFFDALLERAASLTEDPLQQLLIFLKLMAEAMADLPGTHPGCLVASFTYESQQFDDELRDLNRQGVLAWRQLFTEQFEKIVEQYPPKTDKPLLELADMLTTVIEGGIVMSKVLDDRHILPNQLLLYRDYVRRVFGDNQG
jgi:AcrR family transcriptional regulator